MIGMYLSGTGNTKHCIEKLLNYRCISLCPQKAITLLGDQVLEQCRYEKFE